MKPHDPLLGLSLAEVLNLPPRQYQRHRALQKLREQQRRLDVEPDPIYLYGDEATPLNLADLLTLSDKDWRFHHELERAKLRDIRTARQREKATNMADRERARAAQHQSAQRIRDARLVELKARAARLFSDDEE